MKLPRIAVAALILTVAAGFGFGQAIELVGAGATFPAPFYSKVFDEYAKQFGVKVNYQAIGSGGGQAQLKNKTVDFGASDVVVTDDNATTFPAPFVSIPMVEGSVDHHLQSSRQPHAEAHLRHHRRRLPRQDHAVERQPDRGPEPGCQAARHRMTVVHRSDGSGTTAVFSDYLAKVSDEWKSKVGVGQSLNWPVGVGGKGNARRRGPREAASRRGGLRRADLCLAEQHAVCHSEEQERRTGSCPPWHRRVRREWWPIPADVTKIEPDEHRRAQRVSDLDVHLDPRVQGAELRQPPQGQGRRDDEDPVVDGARWAAVRAAPGLRQAADRGRGQGRSPS